MDRSELYMLDTYKIHELVKRLNRITDWSKVDYNERIFHDNDNSIYNESLFISYDKESNLVEYGTVGGLYKLSATNWYYYDELIADEVEEYWTPKLYIITPIYQSDEYELLVACNEMHLYSCFLEKHEEIPKEELTLEEFKENYSLELVKEIDEFNIKCV